MADQSHPDTAHQPLITMAAADLLDAFAASEPVPGGGSASALAGAIGASLLIMVASLAKTRTGAPEEVADLAEASTRLRTLRETLTDLVDRDSAAYSQVVAAMRLPKDTEDEKRARREAIQLAMRGATEVPLDTMRACQQGLHGAAIVASNGTRGAASDTGVAIELLLAGLRGAGMNIDLNLKSLSDASLAERIAAERNELEMEGLADARRAHEMLAAT